MPSRAARAPIVASAPPGRPRSASRSWCCWGSSPPARATAALKARKRRSVWRNSASARYSASVTSRVATVARFISCHDMNCQRGRQGALLAGRARRAYIRRRRTRTQPDPSSTCRPPGPRLALGRPPRRCGRSGGRPGRRAPGAGSARHPAEPARARLRAAPRRRDDRRGRADLPLDPPRRPGARRVRHQRRRLRAGRRAGLPRAEAARYRLPRVRGATAAGGRRRGPPPGAPPPRPRLPRLSRRRAGATLARSLVAHQPLHLALHQGGQPARARRRRVRRAGPRLARGPRAAQLPPERGRDPAPLRRPPRPRAHELLRDRRAGCPPGRARAARAPPRAHLPRPPSHLAERGGDRDRLAPPSVKETPDTLWSGIDLTPAELAAKEAALDEYRTQLPVLGDLLHRFCRQNELYGRVKSRVLDGIAEV